MQEIQADFEKNQNRRELKKSIYLELHQTSRNTTPRK